VKSHKSSRFTGLIKGRKKKKFIFRKKHRFIPRNIPIKDYAFYGNETQYQKTWLSKD